MFKELFTKKNKQTIFWDWFAKNSDAYYKFEQNQDHLFSQLKIQLNKIDDNLVFEFSQVLENGKREFVISADGIKRIFPLVLDLVSNAPQLDKWNIIAFRQPRKDTNRIIYDKLIINYEDVFFRFGRDQDQLALELNIRGFYESAEWTNATFILLDIVLGEYHTEMSLSRIEKKNLDEKEVNDLFPITALPKVIQDFYSELNN